VGILPYALLKYIIKEQYISSINIPRGGFRGGRAHALKFAKHMLCNVKGALATILTKKLYVLEIGK
jgi:hypothetical protein